MEALGLPSLNSLTISRSNFHVQNVFKISKRVAQHWSSSELSSLKLRPFYYSSSELSSPKLRPSCRTHLLHCSTTRMQADGEDYELKQMRDMAAARKRWEALVREEKVKVLMPREAGYAIQLSNKTLLDVRPSTERKKAWVKGSTWIPIFDVDTKFDVGTLLTKITNFTMGGWWSGVPTLSYNNQFLSKVAENYTKDTDLIVACQKGLRSLAACEILYNAGYTNLFWMQGGLEAAEEEDLVTEGPQPLKFAGIGGVSEFLGFTDQQRDAASREGWGYRLVFSARLVGIFIVADALFLGAQQVGHYLQDIRSH
ncbi:rhodanese-like domain-containing protein 11, chloroplastic [Alnus glutinosa]|uniref:rhodanese-like domain-containing protein 11, chloroplastic n=1 Tax=Alnus glutinosa TaxID=3517 RepID=UPI002D78D279|nr:rhodanese-like domain-containing protein 11, chloroplastic [Alnus glutinosa]XP_062168900.1 rhodanese-like domain-containing protein 11, chloroplastic [Alnus glutinosa]